MKMKMRLMNKKALLKSCVEENIRKENFFKLSDTCLVNLLESNK